MNQEFTQLRQLFGCFPEPVFYKVEDTLLPCNDKADTVQPALTSDFCDMLLQLTPGAACLCADESHCFRVTVSPLSGGELLFLRPVHEPPEVGDVLADFSAQLRTRLTILTAVSDQLSYSLRQAGCLEPQERLLAMLSQSIHRLLHFTRQTEVSERIMDIPLQSLDLVGFCRQLSTEISDLADLCHLQFSFESKVSTLLTTSDEALLRELLLVLVSSSLQSARSQLGLRLNQLRNRAVFTIWDDGDRDGDISTLFSETHPDGLPSTAHDEGWSFLTARQITSHFGGFLVAETQIHEGRSIVVSLPVQAPEQVILRSEPKEDNTGGFSPVLVALSDALPWEAYLPRYDY